MASLEKDKKRRLKEADDAYKKYVKAFKNGKISKDELKDKLRPYRFELKELGYNVKIKEDAEQAPQTETAATQAAAAQTFEASEVPTTYPGWKKRSSLTVEEIESRVDVLSLSANPSETLKKLYQQRYGEELAPPLDLVHYEAPSGRVQPPPDGDAPEAGLPPAASEDPERKPFWKGLLRKKGK